jgi:hypothetical protein
MSVKADVGAKCVLVIVDIYKWIYKVNVSVSDIKGRAQTEGVWEQGAEGNTWT